MRLPLIQFVIRVLGVILLAVTFHSCSEPEIRVQPEEPVPEPPPPAGVACKPFVVNGYCSKMSYSRQEKIKTFIHAKNDVYCDLTIQNFKGEPVFTVPSSLAAQQIRTNDSSKEGFGYTMSVEFDIPDHLPSGIYNIENEIFFIVKPVGDVDILVVYPSNTANAYATSGGKSLYTPDRPPAVSFHRPIAIQAFSKYCLQWFNSLSEFRVGYLSDADLDDYSNMEHGKVIVLVGHNEYWTRKARINFDRFINDGKHALILSGNTMWWQVRYSEDSDRSQLICYKDWNADPEFQSLKSVLWNDPRLSYPIVSSIGADFDKGGYGLRSDNGWNGYKIVSPFSPLLSGLDFKKGDLLPCPTTEYDGAPIKVWDEEGYPVLDLEAMDVIKAELVGFDRGFRGIETTGTFIVFQRSVSSGIIINTGSTDWCSVNGMGSSSGDKIKLITLNALRRLLSDQLVFSF